MACQLRSVIKERVRCIFYWLGSSSVAFSDEMLKECLGLITETSA